MFLVSSNPRKLAEIQRYGLNLDLRPGLDLPEVEGIPDEVIRHKALAAGEGAVVEDTILAIDGQPVVDIKWRLAELADHQEVPTQWIVSLGHNDGTHIHLYRGVIEGVLRAPKEPGSVRAGAFGFDPYFVPQGETRSLDELEQQGLKDQFSARRLAVEHLVNRQATQTWAIADIPAWTGRYQAEATPTPPAPSGSRLRR